MNFRCLWIEETKSGFSRKVVTKELSDLPDNEVVIKVCYSSLNYKDLMSSKGNKGITKKYPHIPGIDAVGRVFKSKVPEFKEGDEVIVTGYDLGMNTWGGFAGFISVPAAWIVRLPKNLTMRESMIYGTSGFTAAQSLYHFEKNGVAKNAKVLVTGATGAVGSMAVGLLSKAGFTVIAATRSIEQTDLLLKLGAHEIIESDELVDDTGKGLLKGRWDAVVDTVGGDILVTAIKSTNYRGVVTCCGIVAGTRLSLELYPFILRGVRLIGIDSAECPLSMKRELWEQMANDWKPATLNEMVTEIGLSELIEHLDLMQLGKTYGKVIVKLD